MMLTASVSYDFRPHFLVGTPAEVGAVLAAHEVAASWRGRPLEALEAAMMQHAPHVARAYVQARDALILAVRRVAAAREAQAAIARDRSASSFDPSRIGAGPAAGSPLAYPAGDKDGGWTEWYRHEVSQNAATLDAIAARAWRYGDRFTAGLAWAARSVLGETAGWIERVVNGLQRSILVVFGLAGLFALGALALFAWSPLAPIWGSAAQHGITVAGQTAPALASTVIDGQVALVRAVPDLLGGAARLAALG